MTVYVDDMKAQLGNMIMCHMAADSLDELHTMAHKIGLQRRWFQNKPEHPHYDISMSKRREAIKLGAVEVSQRQMLMLHQGHKPVPLTFDWTCIKCGSRVPSTQEHCPVCNGQGLEEK